MWAHYSYKDTLSTGRRFCADRLGPTRVMAAALGAGSGATCALVALAAPADKVGSVTGGVGVVGAPGGLGGFLPPLVMGFVCGRRPGG
jgi:nitrate/nitrite transporter NarK